VENRGMLRGDEGFIFPHKLFSYAFIHCVSVTINKTKYSSSLHSLPLEKVKHTPGEKEGRS